VHLIRMDTANAKLQAIAPMIRQFGVDYEKSHFKKKCDRGEIDRRLPVTTAAVVCTMAAMVDKDNTILPLLQSGSNAAFREVVFKMAISVVRDSAVGKQIPETLLLDALRIKQLNVCLHTDAMSATIMATTSEKLTVSHTLNPPP
jgi:hypothetical protein